MTLQTGGVAVFLFAGKHDDTDRWLSAHRGLEVAINRETNRLELVYPQQNERPTLTATVTPPETVEPLLPSVSGIDWNTKIKSRILREALLGITADTDDERVLTILEDIGETDQRFAGFLTTLIDLLRQNRRTETDRHIQLYNGELVVVEPTESLDTAVLASRENSDTFVRLGALSEETDAILEDPARFQEWLLFLHPDQRRIVDEDVPASAILTGVSGSGESCALLHRAKRLAQLYHERVLIITLNPSLAELLQTMFQRLPDSVGLRVEVFSYDHVAALLTHVGLDRILRLLNTFPGMTRAIDEFRSRFTATSLGQLLKCRNEVQLRATLNEFTTSARPGEERWNEMSRLEVFLHSQQPNLNTVSYIREEFDLIRSGFRNRDGYRGYIEGYARTGRSIALQENRRQPVLNLLRQWEEWQLTHGVQDQLGLTQLAALVIEEAGELPPDLRYRAVLVDEFQDFSTLDLALLNRIPTQPENGLFLTGDFAQKVFPKEMNVSAVLGQNRSRRRITKNYRNTRQILESGTLLLEAYPPPTDADPESQVLHPEYAEREGPRPFVCQTADPIAAAWAYVTDRLDAGYSAFSVCIATAAPRLISVEAILNQTPANLRSSQLTGSYIPDTETVVISELADVKGFEFGLVIVVGVEDGVFPDARSADGEHWRDALRLYVAMTRARDELRLIYRSSPSPFLTAMWRTVSPLVVEIETSALATDSAVGVSLPDGESTADATVLNGRTIVKIPYEPTQAGLAQALGTTPVQIENYAYPLGVYPTGTTRFAEHHVLAIFERFNVIPLFIRAATRVDTTGRTSRFRAPRPTVKNEIPIHRCQQCGRSAIPGDSICYACS